MAAAAAARIIIKVPDNSHVRYFLSFSTNVYNLPGCS